jgi:hypothetical protein
MNEQKITSLDCVASRINEELEEDLQNIKEDFCKLPQSFLYHYSFLDSIHNSLSCIEDAKKEPHSRINRNWINSKPQINSLLFEKSILKEKRSKIDRIPPQLRMLYYLHQLDRLNQDLIERVSTGLVLIERPETNNEGVDFCCSEAALSVFPSSLIEEEHYKSSKLQLESVYQKLLKFQRKLTWLKTITMPLLVAWSYAEFTVKNYLAFWKNLTRFADRLLLLTGYSLTAFLGQCLSPFDKSWTSDLNELHRQMIEQGKPRWAVLLLIPLHFTGIFFAGLQIVLDELLNSEENLLVHAI